MAHRRRLAGDRQQLLGWCSAEVRGHRRPAGRPCLWHMSFKRQLPLGKRHDRPHEHTVRSVRVHRKRLLTGRLPLLLRAPRCLNRRRLALNPRQLMAQRRRLADDRQQLLVWCSAYVRGYWRPAKKRRGWMQGTCSNFKTAVRNPEVAREQIKLTRNFLRSG